MTLRDSIRTLTAMSKNLRENEGNKQGGQEERNRRWEELRRRAQAALSPGDSERAVMPEVGRVFQPTDPHAPLGVHFLVMSCVEPGDKLVLVPLDGLNLTVASDWRWTESDAPHAHVARCSLALVVARADVEGWSWCGELPSRRVREVKRALFRILSSSEQSEALPSLEGHLAVIRTYVDQLAPDRWSELQRFACGRHLD